MNFNLKKKKIRLNAFARNQVVLSFTVSVSKWEEFVRIAIALTAATKKIIKKENKLLILFSGKVPEFFSSIYKDLKLVKLLF